VSFSFDRTGNTLHVAVLGQLVTSNRQELKRAVFEELDRGVRHVRLDLAKTGYIDSAGLGLLLQLSKKIRELGGELHVANPNADFRTLFRLTKLDTLLQMED
jgi:anti-sigma B factor antagonist